MRPHLILAAVALMWAAPASASSFQAFGAPKPGVAPSVTAYGQSARPAQPAVRPDAGRPSASVIVLGAPPAAVSNERTAAIRPKWDRNGAMGPMLIRGGVASFASTPEQPASAVAESGKPREAVPAAAQPADDEITEDGPTG